MKKTITHKEVCPKCKGTGLYVGMAERDGAAVVCHQCSGTGCFEYRHEYEPFTQRRARSGILRVIETNPGIIVNASQAFGGLPANDWAEGKPFPRGSEMRQHTCPAWWFQSADYSRKPEWAECHAVGRFSDCSRFCNKSKCWERHDSEGTGSTG